MVIKSSRPMWTERIGVWISIWSGVRWGIEPREEVAMNDGSGRLHLNDDLERAKSDNEREVLFEVEPGFGSSSLCSVVRF